jgi:hypothetical protein
MATVTEGDDEEEEEATTAAVASMGVCSSDAIGRSGVA